MKSLIFSLSLLLYIACSSSAITTPEETADSSYEIPIETVENEDIQVAANANPSEVTFKLKLIESFSSKKDICDVERNHVILVEVLEIIERAMGVTHMPLKKEEVLMNFILAPEELKVDTVIEVRAKESLCRDASKNYFTIISYKIVE